MTEYERIWDAIVIGTGIGGGTIGRRLAEAGLKVLFVEYGPFSPATEEQDGYPVGDRYARLMHGVWPSDGDFETNGRLMASPMGIGAGVGGTSVFYAATLERPEPHDFDCSDARPHPTGGWPAAYAEFDRYFAAAERIYNVVGEKAGQRGGAPRRRDTEYERELRQFFEKSGLHPYRTPTGAKFLPGCSSCFGRKCPRGCKMDGRTAGVEPAIATGNATLLDWCEAVRFHGSGDRIDYLEARHRGRSLQLKARRFILSAGALNSPRLLQRSVSEAWPNGCANASGMVGRNLMFHLNELFALWPRHKGSVTTAAKAFSMRDFYYREDLRLGLFQALGVSADYQTIRHFLSSYAQQGMASKIPALHHFLHLSAAVSARVLGNAEIYVGILEDFPHPDNIVTNEGPDTDGIRVVYNFTEELLNRRKRFRKIVGSAFPRGRYLALNRAPQVNHAHACGTVRFGHDPKNSVLNKYCRSHEVRNLFCVDASFMPTSNGVNPSLTIAANALRVGDHIVQNMGQQV